MIEVAVTGSWADASQALSDIATAMGATPTEWYYKVTFTLWGGEALPNEFAVLDVEWGEGGYSYQFGTPPDSGTAYIIGAVVSIMAG